MGSALPVGVFIQSFTCILIPCRGCWGCCGGWLCAETTVVNRGEVRTTVNKRRLKIFITVFFIVFSRESWISNAYRSDLEKVFSSTMTMSPLPRPKWEPYRVPSMQPYNRFQFRNIACPALRRTSARTVSRRNDRGGSGVLKRINRNRPNRRA